MNPLQPIILFLLIAATPFISHAELVQLRIKGDLGTAIEYSDTTVNLAEGDMAEIVSLASRNSHAHLEVNFPDAMHLIYLPGGDFQGDMSRDLKIMGPASIKLTNRDREEVTDGSNFSEISYITLLKVTRGDTPAGAIMVPKDDPTATFEVFMEASTDMETWVRVIPGDYDASGGAKFFRVRMVKK